MLENPTILACRKSLLIGKKNISSKASFLSHNQSNAIFPMAKKNDEEEIGISSQL